MTQTNNNAEQLTIKLSREEIQVTGRLYDFAGKVLTILHQSNPESTTSTINSAYVWDKYNIIAAARALNIDENTFYSWCYDHSDFITTRVLIRAAIALSPESPAPSQADRLFEWSLIKERANRTEFRHKHDEYKAHRSREQWDGQKFRKLYSPDDLALHLMLECEVFYTWNDTTVSQALEYLRTSYPDLTVQDLQRVYNNNVDMVTSIYG